MNKAFCCLFKIGHVSTHRQLNISDYWKFDISYLSDGFMGKLLESTFSPTPLVGKAHCSDLDF